MSGISEWSRSPNGTDCDHSEIASPVQQRCSYMAVSIVWGSSFLGVLLVRALLLWVYIRAN